MKKVTCYIGKTELCKLEWNEMPSIGMAFDFEKRKYYIIDIKNNSITVKDITKKRKAVNK